MLVLEIFIGAVIALVLLLPLKSNEVLQIKIWSIALVIAALVYVGFALFVGDREWLPIEFAGVLIYAVPAILALRHHPWWLVIGWIGHILWDIGLHAGGHPGFVPAWYPGLCIGFDLAVAGYWAYRILRKPSSYVLKEI